jgi:hypothetical protein
LRKWQGEQGVEISEAEHAVHHGFDHLRGAIGAYLAELLSAKSPEGVKRKEAKLSRGLAKEIEEIESGIEKEVEDIEKVGKHGARKQQ